jgi:hypothetical protein
MKIVKKPVFCLSSSDSYPLTVKGRELVVWLRLYDSLAATLHVLGAIPHGQT